MKIEIFDSTLRDGAQSEGISFSVSDKLNVVRALDSFKVDYIEAGNPGSNPKDIEFFQRVKEIELAHAKLCAFGATRRKNLKANEDENLVALVNAGTPAVAVFGKSWDLHIKEILGVSVEENLQIVYDTIKFLKDNDKEVIFDAEHFFDGFKANQEVALAVLKKAHEAGADVLTLCDTNGGTLPIEIYDIVKKVKESLEGVRLGIHCHNDLGSAVANSLLAIDGGVCHVQGTFIGIGERTGNADLSVIIPTIKLKSRNTVDCEVSGLTQTVREVYDICNLILPANKPFTGSSAFAHKGGMHVDGVNKCANSFEHIPPEAVGNKRRFLMSEMSGRTTLLSKLKTIAPSLTKSSPELAEILNRLKVLEHEGYQFEAADASFELRVMAMLDLFSPHFRFLMYKTSGEYPSPDGEQTAYALVKVAVGEQTETSAAQGNGPVNALDSALRKALYTFYPQLQGFYLTDYKVRVLSADATTGSKVRVLIESSDGKNTWTTVGVSADIIEASSIALQDSIEYFLKDYN